MPAILAASAVDIAHPYAWNCSGSGRIGAASHPEAGPPPGPGLRMRPQTAVANAIENVPGSSPDASPTTTFVRVSKSTSFRR